VGGWVGSSKVKDMKKILVMCIPVPLFKYSQHLHIRGMNILYILF